MADNSRGQGLYDADEVVEHLKDKNYGFVSSEMLDAYSTYKARKDDYEESKNCGEKMLEELRNSKVIPVTDRGQFNVIKTHLEDNPDWKGIIQVVVKTDKTGEKLKKQLIKELSKELLEGIQIVTKVDSDMFSS